MRNTRIFSGSSHPSLTASICTRLGTSPSAVQLDKFSNGETSVRMGTSIRDADVFIVQSGSEKVNDSLMELLIMISACKGGSAKKITAVMPYFPYSRQSKKKSHRGAITGKMLANFLVVAGVHHVITVDIHASQMQGFFSKPIDNLYAEPLIARWIRHHVPNWHEAVVVSKNPGGTKRVTSLADALKLNFGIVTTDRRRKMDTSIVFGMDGTYGLGRDDMEVEKEPDPTRRRDSQRRTNGTVNGESNPRARRKSHNSRRPQSGENRLEDEDYNDERATDVVTGRLVNGRLVDDDYPSPTGPSPTIPASASTAPPMPGGQLPPPASSEAPDPMTSSIMSSSSYFSSNNEHALGGTYDAGISSGEEDAGLQTPDVEKTITLVGNVKDKTVFIMDDMIDKPGTWIAAAETVVKRGGAQKVYCIATHGLFGNDCLQQLENCDSIDHIVVTNSFPIPAEKARVTRKLIVLDLSNLLAEAIRRNHYGESISQLFLHFQD